jgi:hypothetical protein
MQRTAAAACLFPHFKYTNPKCCLPRSIKIPLQFTALTHHIRESADCNPEMNWDPLVSRVISVLMLEAGAGDMNLYRHFVRTRGRGLLSELQPSDDWRHCGLETWTGDIVD